VEEVVYFNGKLMPRSQASLSVLDYGFLFGYGLYETIRAYDGKMFRLDSHLERLENSAQKIGIQLNIPELRQGVQDTVRANGFFDTRVRITVSLGEGSMTPDIRSCRTPTLLVLAGEYHPYSLEKYESGFKTIVSSIKRNNQSPVTFMKSANSMENMLARQEARETGFDEALFLNTSGYVTEASGSNVFMVAEGIVKTPELKNGILAGVTRSAIFEVAGKQRIPISEASIRLEELQAADEVFLTNSLIEVVPFVQLGSKGVSGGAVGPVTRLLMEAYRQLVVNELHAQ
jgi:branched-chain amino acid aminotransferase